VHAQKAITQRSRWRGRGFVCPQQGGMRFHMERRTGSRSPSRAPRCDRGSGRDTARLRRERVRTRGRSGPRLGRDAFAALLYERHGGAKHAHLKQVEIFIGPAARPGSPRRHLPAVRLRRDEVLSL